MTESLIHRVGVWAEQTGAMNVRLSIGDFSRMTYLSIKSLRRYHDMGLLVPANPAVKRGVNYGCHPADSPTPHRWVTVTMAGVWPSRPIRRVVIEVPGRARRSRAVNCSSCVVSSTATPPVVTTGLITSAVPSKSS